MKLSRDIIIRLINEKAIDGEEAFVLINDCLKTEMLELKKSLDSIDRLNDRFTYSKWPEVTYDSASNAATTPQPFQL